MVLLIPILFLVVMFLIIEGTHFHVYGWFIKEEELDAYLGKYLPTATLNPYSENGTLFSDMPRYVSRSNSILCKWSIERYGVIPRWSKWTKQLDEKRAELMEQRVPNTRKKLTDY